MLFVVPVGFCVARDNYGLVPIRRSCVDSFWWRVARPQLSAAAAAAAAAGHPPALRGWFPLRALLSALPYFNSSTRRAAPDVSRSGAHAKKKKKKKSAAGAAVDPSHQASGWRHLCVCARLSAQVSVRFDISADQIP